MPTNAAGRTGRLALVTDFGTRDPYAAAVKAVIAARCDAMLIDLTHEIAPGDLFEAAWFLRSIGRFLGPAAEESHPRTICMTVVDPGVGTDRRIVAVASGGVVHLAPDNGVLTFVIDEEAAAFSVENERLYLPSGSTTFHGRDRFAPVAAALASGMALETLGPRVETGGLVRLRYEEPRYRERSAAGQIVSIDRFGNAITDIDAERWRSMGSGLTASTLSVTARRNALERKWVMRIRSTYEPAAGLEPFVIIGSQGTAEIAVAGGSAAEVLQLARFDRLELVASL